MSTQGWDSHMMHQHQNRTKTAPFSLVLLYLKWRRSVVIATKTVNFQLRPSPKSPSMRNFNRNLKGTRDTRRTRVTGHLTSPTVPQTPRASGPWQDFATSFRNEGRWGAWRGAAFGGVTTTEGLAIVGTCPAWPVPGKGQHGDTAEEPLRSGGARVTPGYPTP